MEVRRENTVLNILNLNWKTKIHLRLINKEGLKLTRNYYRYRGADKSLARS